MNERIIPITLKVPTQAAGANLAGVKLPVIGTLVGVSASLDAVTGGPTDVKYDLLSAGSNISGFNAISVGTTAAATTLTKSKHFGGTIDPVEIAAGNNLTVSTTITGGSSPTAGLTVVLYLLMGE
ncbi:MAG: hypothetical protein HY259_10315 [Chloroflexi bacterium]|nr:hypothetical protein [Chloroflexota bacterium]